MSVCLLSVFCLSAVRPSVCPSSPTLSVNKMDIIDSHVHLFSADQLDSLNWYTTASTGHPLGSEHCLPEYAAALAAATPEGRIGGFVWVEADAKHDLTMSPPDYSGPLGELAHLRRVLESQTETKTKTKTKTQTQTQTLECVAAVPWAPLPLGAAALETYLAEAEQIAGPALWRRVRGFRYLVQDKPAGTMVGAGFVEGLRLLGRKGFAFDLGADAHRRGAGHLAEAVEMVRQAHEGVPEGERVTVVISKRLSE